MTEPLGGTIDMLDPAFADVDVLCGFSRRGSVSVPPHATCISAVARSIVFVIDAFCDACAVAGDAVGASVMAVTEIRNVFGRRVTEK